MKRKNILIALTLLLSLTAYAQNAAQAKQILDKAAKLITRKGGASANFTIDGGASGKLSGTLYVKGNKFYAKTPQAATWYNGKTQWTYLAKSEEVNVSNPNAAQQAQMNPYTFITLYKKGYALAMKTVGNSYQIICHTYRSFPSALCLIQHFKEFFCLYRLFKTAHRTEFICG